MILESIVGLAISSLFIGAKLKENGGPGNDHEKIKMIAEANGLMKNGQSIRIHRKYRPKNKHYTEYVYQIPLGLSLEDFEEKHQKFQDGINNKQMKHLLSLKELKKVKLKDLKKIQSLSNLPDQLREIFGEKQVIRKSIEMSYDGMLKMRVYDRDIPSSINFNPSLWEKCKDWHIPVGETRDGVFHLRLDDGHTVVAGTTRYGKTVFLHLLINSFMHNHQNQVEFSLVDLKGKLSFNQYANCKQVKIVAGDLAETHQCLKEAITELNKRREILLAQNVQKIQQCKTPMKRHYIIIDEAGNLDPKRMDIHSAEDLKKAKFMFEQCQAWMKRIAAEAAGLGIYLVFSTQYPTTEVLDSQIKANTINKVCYRLDTGIQSKTVLDEVGAEDIKIPGRAIVRTPDGTQQVQTYFINDDQIQENITPHIVIKARKDEQQHEESRNDAGKTGEDTLFIEEIGIC